jgi:hypothetical protein
MHYDRQGRPLDLLEWARLLEDSSNRIVRRHWCRGWLVSTIWLGIDYSSGAFPSPGGPLIFETMIFGPEGHSLSSWCTRAPTEEMAIDVHWEAIGLVTAETGVFLEDVTGCSPGSYEPSSIATLETSGEGYSRGGLRTATEDEVEELLGIRPLEHDCLGTACPQCVTPLRLAPGATLNDDSCIWPDAMHWVPGMEDSL